MTSLAEAFEKAGIRAEDVEFDRAIAKYLNSGGTIERAVARVQAAADRMRSVGHSADAESGLVSVAYASQPVESGEAKTIVSQDLSWIAEPLSSVEDGGAIPSAPQGQRCSAPPSSPNRGGKDQPVFAKSGQSPNVLPVREPSVTSISGAAAARIVAARSVFDVRKTSDGRMWGSVGAHELDGMERDGTIAKAVKAHLGALSNKQRFMTIRELMTEAQFKKALSQAGVA